MIEVQNTGPLASRIDELLTDIKDLDSFYKHNEEMLDIYEGNLLPYVEKLMEETLDARYFKLIKHRILPINFSQKIVGKLAKSYGDEPIRSCDDQDFMDAYTKMIQTSSKMALAEEYAYLNRGYALKPKLTNKGKIKMDVLPFDKFFVKADDNSDTSIPTVFVEFLGKTKRSKVGKNDKEQIMEVDCYMAYSDTEIIAFDSDGDKINEHTESLNDKNPIGAIPFVYGNRSVSNIVPKQDTDFLKLSKILPLMLSDINGAIMFQCFTLIYGIDIEFNDAVMSPNAIWDLSSNPRSDKPAQIGTLTPTVDSDKALTFFKNILSFWLDSKGIDAGSIMQLDSKAMASGLSKAMDELDTTEARKKSINALANEEKELYVLLAKLNNYWMKVAEAKPLKLKKVNVQLVEDTIEIEFKEPMPKLDYTTEITNSVTMIKEGLSYREKEIKRLAPYASEDEINQIFFEYGVDRHEIGSKDVVDGVDPAKTEEPIVGPGQATDDETKKDEDPAIIEENPEEEQ